MHQTLVSTLLGGALLAGGYRFFWEQFVGALRGPPSYLIWRNQTKSAEAWHRWLEKGDFFDGCNSLAKKGQGARHNLKSCSLLDRFTDKVRRSWKVPTIEQTVVFCWRHMEKTAKLFSQGLVLWHSQARNTGHASTKTSIFAAFARTRESTHVELLRIRLWWTTSSTLDCPWPETHNNTCQCWDG